MKRLALTIFLACGLLAQAQHRSSVETRALMRQYAQSKSATQAVRLFEGQLAVQQDGKGGATVRAMAQLAPGTPSELLENQGVKVTSRVADIVALRLPLEGLFTLEQCPEVMNYTVCHRASLHCDKARVDTHADSVQEGINLPQAFKGDGVLVGVCDWGFDYQHPNLNHKDEKRIFAAWDQFKHSGPAPEGFDYGTAYYGYDALVEAQVDTSNIYGYNSHGTHCSGIIGGRGTKKESASDKKFTGIAPHAQFLCGSWLLDEASWMDLVSWMYGVAKQEQKRLVISNSWGMYSFSAIDGTSLASQALNHYADSGVVFVTSAGNNGDQACHLMHTFAQGDTLRTMANYYNGNGGQMLILWGEPGQTFKACVGLSSTTNGPVSKSPFFSTNDNIDYQEGYLVVDNGDTVRYSVMCESANACNQRPHMLLKVDKEGNDKLHLFLTAENGAIVQAWNINYVREHESNIGMDFVTGGRSGYIAGDPYRGIGEPACAEKSIAVAAHAAGRFVGEEWMPGNIAYFSSYGPTMDGRTKPDISAPGVDVISSVSSWDTEERNYEASILSGGRYYKWAKMSGTSMSGPMVAGACALLLQANPNLSVDTVKALLTRTAINDERTGNLSDSVSDSWGHGKLNVYGAVCAAIDKLSVAEVQEHPIALELYPNPASERVTLRTYTLEESLVEVYSLSGQRVLQRKVQGGETTFDLQGWQSGLYIVRSHDRSGVRTAKLIVK